MQSVGCLGKTHDGKIKMLYSVAELSAMVSLSKATLYNEIKQGRLVSTKFGKKNLLKIEDISRWLEAAPLSQVKEKLPLRRDGKPYYGYRRVGV